MKQLLSWPQHPPCRWWGWPAWGGPAAPAGWPGAAASPRWFHPCPADEQYQFSLELLEWTAWPKGLEWTSWWQSRSAREHLVIPVHVCTSSREERGAPMMQNCVKTPEITEETPTIAWEETVKSCEENTTTQNRKRKQIHRYLLTGICSQWREGSLTKVILMFKILTL